MNNTFNKSKEKREIIKNKIINGIKVDIKDFAKYMRFNPTFGEYLLYHDFLEKRPEKIRRQHPLNIFIADFYCHKLKLIIEVDGSSHDNKLTYDLERDNYFINKGYFVARVLERDVLQNIEGVALFLSDVFKYIYLLKKYSLTNDKGQLFSVSPLAFGKEEILNIFTEEERKSVVDVFEDFEKI